MQIKSYRARSVQEALALVRADLGPDAAVLHTREVNPGAMRFWRTGRQIEVIATPEASQVPSRAVPDQRPEPQARLSAPPLPPTTSPAPAYRSSLAAIANEGFDLLAADIAASGDVAAEEWPTEVAAHFVKMLSAMAPQDRQRVVTAIAAQARGKASSEALL